MYTLLMWCQTWNEIPEMSLLIDAELAALHTKMSLSKLRFCAFSEFVRQSSIDTV